MQNILTKSEREYIKKCQKHLLILLCYIDSFCRKNNIKYSLDCGTLIGAIREKGFIEWDDDADIILTRNEYEKLLIALKKEKLPDYVGIYYPEKKKYFLDFNVRLYYKKEKIRNDEDSLKKYDGLFSHATLDIYVLDNLPCGAYEKRMYILKQQLIFGLAMSKRNGIKYKKYTLFTKFAVLFLSTVGKIYDIKLIHELHTKFSKAYIDKKCHLLYCTSWAPEYPGYQFNKNFFTKYQDIKFENKKLMITKDYDKVLKIEYGDYMKPKKTHQHDDFINKL